jgi:hypothetical protein
MSQLDQIPRGSDLGAVVAARELLLRASDHRQRSPLVTVECIEEAVDLLTRAVDDPVPVASGEYFGNLELARTDLRLWLGISLGLLGADHESATVLSEPPGRYKRGRFFEEQAGALSGSGDIEAARRALWRAEKEYVRERDPRASFLPAKRRSDWQPQPSSFLERTTPLPTDAAVLGSSTAAEMRQAVASLRTDT